MSRLNTIFYLIEPCLVFADIGTDHGLIAKAALPFSKKVIASDISEKCLFKARNLLRGCEMVEFLVSDGLKNYTQNPCIISICGMGGHTIIDILTDYFIKNKTAKLILQPQNDAFALRQFLYQNNYSISHDILAKEKNKFYTIIKASCHSGCSEGLSDSDYLTTLQLLFGKFYKEQNPLLKEKLKQDLTRLQAYKATQKNGDLIQKTKEALSWQS